MQQPPSELIVAEVATLVVVKLPEHGADVDMILLYLVDDESLDALDGALSDAQRRLRSGPVPVACSSRSRLLLLLLLRIGRRLVDPDRLCVSLRRPLLVALRWLPKDLAAVCDDAERLEPSLLARGGPVLLWTRGTSLLPGPAFPEDV